MIKLLAFATFFSVMVLTGCSTDVDNYATYKDISIVYGMIEPGADTTWIKISRAYLGPGNALLIAKEPDSSNYPGKLDAKLIKVKGANETIIQLDTLTRTDKLAGDSIFYFPQQKLYYTTSSVDPAAEYRLVVNKGNDAEVSSLTRVVQSFGLTFPTNRINFHSTTTTAIRWVSAVNGKRYEAKLVFYYKELLPDNPDTLYKTLTWDLGMLRSSNTNGGENMEILINGEEFYTRLGGQMENILNVKRWAGPVDIFVSCGADELSTYIDVNAPSNSIIQEIPEYTNIENGFGIFSSRLTSSRRYPLAVGSELKLVEDFEWGFIVNR
jgi:hypothetical protein